MMTNSITPRTILKAACNLRLRSSLTATIFVLLTMAITPSAFAAPALQVISQTVTTRAGVGKITHLVITSMKSCAYPHVYSITINLPGEIDNSPYQPEHGRIISNKAQTLLAVNYRLNRNQEGLGICLFQSTNTNIRVTPRFDQRISATLRTRRAMRMIMRSWHIGTPPDKIVITKQEVRNWQSSGADRLSKELRVDQIGDTNYYNQMTFVNEFSVRAQSHEVNDAFILVHLTDKSQVILDNCWQEGE